MPVSPRTSASHTGIRRHRPFQGAYSHVRQALPANGKRPANKPPSTRIASMAEADAVLAFSRGRVENKNHRVRDFREDDSQWVQF